MRRKLTDEEQKEVTAMVEASRGKRSVHRFRKKWTTPANESPNMMAIWQEIGKKVYSRLTEKKTQAELGSIQGEVDIVFMSAEQWEEIEPILEKYDAIMEKHQ